ncbi:unnamed protein product, partial [Bubo scandiacus]
CFLRPRGQQQRQRQSSLGKALSVASSHAGAVSAAAPHPTRTLGFAAPAPHTA